METIVFGGGCFWCTEAVFKSLAGVIAVTPGYAGGEKTDPTYDDVCGGTSGHAEVVKVDYDPKRIAFDDLLTVFFATHDPTTLNRQGNDIGSQYRSAIFYTNESQREASEKFVTEIEASAPGRKRIVTEIKPLAKFYTAEEHHQNYYAKNPASPYCAVIIEPKLAKVQQKFAQLLKSSV